MRTKNTAHKFMVQPNHAIEEESVSEKKLEISEENEVERRIPEEVEMRLECHTDNAGNQFLSDGTPIIEPTPVSSELVEGQEGGTDAAWVPDCTGRSSSSSTASSSVTGVMVKCTACNKRFNPYIGSNLHTHSSLGVIVCWDCARNQAGNYFVVDSSDDKETLCRWCVEGGYLICCDFCPKSFCKNCIRRNLGKDYLALILKQDQDLKWRCFVCDDKPTAPLRDKCKMLTESVEEHQKRNITQNRKRESGKIPMATTNTDASPTPSCELATLHQSPPRAASPPSLTLATAPSNTETRKRIAPMPHVLPTPPIKAPTLVSVVADLIPLTSGAPTSTLVPKLSLNTALQTCAGKHWQNGAYRTANYENMRQISKIQHHGNSYYLRNNSVQTMLSDIDTVSTKNVISGIHATKCLIESFYSDLHNLEVEISQAASSDDLELVSSTFKALYRHHVFSRLGKLSRRLSEKDSHYRRRHNPVSIALRNGGGGSKIDRGEPTFIGTSNITITNVVSNVNSTGKIYPPAVVDLTDDAITSSTRVSPN